jgi:predicted polyphosphate/ATP-dependent NAD kinase
MDVDEKAFRRDRLSIRLYGYMKCLYVPMMSQRSKELSPEVNDEKENQKAVAKTVVEDMDPNALYILGPGTTVKCLADTLGAKKTILGVDLYYKGQIITPDVDEETILREIENHGGRGNTWIVVSPIGRQGVLFGRGNQQISPTVIEEVGKDHIIVVATKSKVRDLDGGYLRVDTGDKDADRLIRGYVKVVTDYREWRMLRVR